MRATITSDANYLRMRAGAGTDQPAKGYLANGDIIAVDETRKTMDVKGRPWYPVVTTATSDQVFEDEALTEFAQYEIEGWVAGWLITLEGTPTPDPHPPVVFTVAPASITAGQVVRLSWSVEGVAGVRLDGKDEAGVMTRERYPAKDTTYTLAVEYRDGTTEEFKRSVTVKAAPVPVLSDYPLAIGAHTLNENGENLRTRLAPNQKSLFVCLDNADVASQLTRLGHNAWLRHWAPDADYSAAQIAGMMNYVSEDIRAKVGAILNNEADWGFAQKPGESVKSWLQRASDKHREVMRLLYAAGWRKFSIGNFSMGCPDLTNDEIRYWLGECYRGMYNHQTIDGTPNGPKAEIWWDQHNYVPNLSWLYDDAGVAGANHAVYLGMPNTRIRRERLGLRSSAEATWIEPVDPVASAKMLLGALPNKRFIHKWDWLLTRHNFLFWEEMGIGFDPNVKRCFSSEGLFDEGGVGGAKAHNYTPKQVQAAIIRMLDLLQLPVVVNGISYSSPHRGFATFVSAKGDPKWSGGYGIDYVITSPEADVTKWTRA